MSYTTITHKANLHFCSPLVQKRFCTRFRPFSRGKSAFEQVNHPLQLQAHIVPNQLSKVQHLVFHEIVQTFVLPDLALRSWLGGGRGI